jgi:predicted Zn-dependent protease
MRRINPVFLAGLLTVSIVLARATYLVHGFQLQRNVEAMLDRARKAEEDKALSEAALALKQYLNLRRGDGGVWRWYARLMDELHGQDEGRRQELFLIYEEALRNNPGNRQLELRCVELALDPYLNQSPQAKKHLAVLLGNPRDSRERAKLEDLRGQAEASDSNFEEAARSFALAIEHDPALVSSYLRLARLRRTELRKDPKEADDLIDGMVRNNTTLGTAYLTRFLYNNLYRPPADRGDIRKALELAPENVEVLGVAAAAAEQSRDPSTARAYLEKGLKLDPGNTAIARTLADLELGDQHPDRAVAVLRDAVRLKPETMAVFRLAELLIEQGKADRASEYVAPLESRGFGQSLVRVLNARRLMVDQKWPDAIREIEAALVVLRSAPELSARLELMLAECHGRTGSDQQRVAALRRAVDGGVRAEAPRLDLARALIREREWDEAIKILEPMSEQRPELHLDITEVLIQKNLGLPRDARSWGLAEASLRRAESALAQRPEFDQRLTLLRADLLAAQGHLQRAQDVIRARVKDSKDLAYGLASAELARRATPDGLAAIAILDEAEKELGASIPLNIARLAYWSRRGGDKAVAEVAKLAGFRKGLKIEDRGAYLQQLGQAMVRLNRPAEARTYWNELAELAPNNLPVQLVLFDLALESGDQAEAEKRIERIKQTEGEQGTRWRFARATILINRYRRSGANGSSAARSNLDEARKLTEQIARRRKEWWGSSLLEAQIAELKPDVDEAIEAYKQVIKRGNTQPLVVMRLLALLYRADRIDEIGRLGADLRDRPKEAEALIQTAIIGTPGDPEGLRAAASLSLMMGKTDEVGKYLDALASPGAAPEDLAWANRIRATVLLGTGRAADRDRALTLVERNLKGKAGNARAVEDLVLWARIQAMRSATADKAIKILRELDADGRLGPDEQFLLARLYLGGGRENEFQDEMLKILVQGDSQSPNPQHLGTLIDFLIARGRLDQAERWLAELRRIDPKSPTTLELRASLLRARNPDRTELPELRDLLEAHVRQDPDQIGVVAVLLDRFGFFKQAEEAYRAYVEKDRAKPERELALARFLATRRDDDRTSDAVAILSRAWKTCPPEQVALAALSLYDAPSATESQREQVDAWLDEARRRRPDLLLLTNKLAAIRIRQGKFYEAEEMYRRLLDGDPENVEALNNLAWLLALRGQGSSKSPGEPLELINRAIEIAGRTPSLLDTKAVVLIRANRLVEAMHVLDDARPLDGRNARVPLHRALALRGQGKTEEARDAFRAAVKLGWRPDRSDPLERSLIDQLRRELGL